MTKILLKHDVNAAENTLTNLKQFVNETERIIEILVFLGIEKESIQQNNILNLNRHLEDIASQFVANKLAEYSFFTQKEENDKTNLLKQVAQSKVTEMTKLLNNQVLIPLRGLDKQFDYNRAYTIKNGMCSITEKDFKVLNEYFKIEGSNETELEFYTLLSDYCSKANEIKAKLNLLEITEVEVNELVLKSDNYDIFPEGFRDIIIKNISK